MKLTQLLDTIDKLARQHNLSQPYIVGGLPRDRLLDRAGEINDVDITTGDETVHQLAQEVARVLEGPAVSFAVMDDGHAKIKIGSFKIDFSSNFQIPNIESILKKAGIESPTEMQKELYSRDFTCNTCLMTLDLKIIWDPTGLAVEDIQDRVIKTCLPPYLTFGYDPKRIVRSIYLASKLNFDLDSKTKAWIQRNPEKVLQVKPSYLSKKLGKGMKKNPRKVISLIQELGLSEYLSDIPEVSPYL